MSYHNILSKNDRALMAYLISQEVGDITVVVPAKRSADKQAPMVACYSESAVDLSDSGTSATFTITASIIVKSIGAVDVNQTGGAVRLQSDALVQAAFDCFYLDVDSAGDKLAEDITAAARALAVSDPDNHSDLADYTCLNVMVKGIEAGFDGDAWLDTLKLEMVACPSNVS